MDTHANKLHPLVWEYSLIKDKHENELPDA